MQSVYLSETIIPGRGREAEQKRRGPCTTQPPFPAIPACTCSHLFVWLLFFICSDPRGLGVMHHFHFFLLVWLFIEKLISVSFRSTCDGRSGCCTVDLLWYYKLSLKA